MTSLTGDGTGVEQNPLLGTDWGGLLKDELDEQWPKLQSRIEQERLQGPVFPPANEIFRAFELTSCERTKVVILGQDPYHGAGQAHGLCFSVPCGTPKPPSLRNIHEELHADRGVPIPDHGSLESWADRGVLLLNTSLTVGEGRAGSHKTLGWKGFTDAVIRVVTEESDPVFLLWGKEAQRREQLITSITGSPGKIIKSSHPAPMSAYRPCCGSPPFVGNGPFSKANTLLRRSGSGEVDWGPGPCPGH